MLHGGFNVREVEEGQATKLDYIEISPDKIKNQRSLDRINLRSSSNCA
jgi:hypothetical protein